LKLGCVQNWVTKNGDPREPRNNLLEELQLLSAELRQIEEHARNISAGLCESADESRGDRVTF